MRAYKRFKINKTERSENDFVWEVYGKQPGWFKPWLWIGDRTTEEDAVALMRDRRRYPIVLDENYYDEAGRLEYDGFCL